MSLGKIFQAIIVMEPNEQSPIRQFNAIMRSLAVFMFKKWKQERNEHYQLFRSDAVSKYFDKKMENSLGTPVAEQAYLTAKKLEDMTKMELKRDYANKQINNVDFAIEDHHVISDTIPDALM